MSQKQLEMKPHDKKKDKIKMKRKGKINGDKK
jgi:hypothetical protein